ncbi:zinc finger, CCHC-type containing protein [Tanacetum coccineum]|uniref:Zinc finger, CCHC-type containing protein n=1 Tax=Tanacetum coccineum TaxID=301880 RepID=A0ABQ5DA54_9ASTR
MKSCGIVSQLTPPYTPQHNGGYALETAARILNIVLTKKVDRTPYEIWHGKSPKLSYLRVTLRKRWVTTFTVHSKTRSLFLETLSSLKIVLWYKKRVEPQNVRVSIRRSTRIPQVPDRYGYYVDIEEYELGDLDEPPNYKAALAYPESDKWLEAMNRKMQSMKDNQVWYLVDLPSNGRTVGCKWLFKKKTDMDGNVHTFKARLVAKGFTQTYRVDYGETFSLVADIRAIKILLAIIASKWLIGLSQSAYLEKILKKFRMENPKKGYTSIMEKPDYRKSRFQQNPSEIHLTAVKTILKYLRNTKDMVFVYGAKPEDDLKVSCYTDASFQTDKDDTKSQTGYVFVLNGEAVDWKSAKQNTTAMSSIEAEYIATAEASMEAVWIRKFIDGLGGVMPSNKRPMEMLCDNEPTLAISNNNVADPFTKPVPLNKHFEHAMAIGIDPTSSLRYEKKIKFVEQPIRPAPDLETADPDMIDQYYESVSQEQEVACLMLSKLKTMFEEQAKQELFETVKAFHACKQEDGQSVSSYLLKMKSYLDTLERIGYAMPNELCVSLILNSLNKDYDQFVQNYNMHSMWKTIAELHVMLKLHEKGIPKKAETPAVLAIREGKIQKDKKKPQGAISKAKGKNKLAYAPKTKIPPPPKRYNPAKDYIYPIIRSSYWRRMFIRNHAELDKEEKNAGFRRSKKLKHGALHLYMGNEMRATVEAIGSFDLILPSGLIIVLDNGHYAPTVTRGVVSISRFHYRLGHINKKRMDMLQRDGLLQPTHDESHEKCKSCISGKMARKPFPHQVERAKDLLRLIHTKLC